MEQTESKKTSVKKSKIIIICVIAFIITKIIGGLLDSSSNEYLALLDMNKSEIEQKYGIPETQQPIPEMKICRYKDGFTLVYNNDVPHSVTLESGCKSSAEMFGLKIGDPINDIEKAMKKHNMQFMGSSEKYRAVKFKDENYILLINYSGNIITTLYVIKT